MTRTGKCLATVCLLATAAMIDVATAQTSPGCQVLDRTAPLSTGVVSYFETGNGPTVVLLHGLFAQKEQWLTLACGLSSAGWRAVAPDLPGFGKSTGFFISDHRLKRQAALVQQFIDYVADTPTHLAGNSMGGAVAALVAAEWPGQVRTLALIGGPMGVTRWGRQLQAAIDQGQNPFIPDTVALFDREMDLLFAKPPIIGDDHKQAAAAYYRNNLARHWAIWHTATQDALILEHATPQGLPTLILWGEEDQVFEVSALPSAQALFPRHRTLTLPRVGHLPMLEAPATVVQQYVRFLSKH